MDMKPNNNGKKFQKNLQSDISKMEKANKEKRTILSQTVYLGTIGVMFIIPVIVGAYVGVWLDNKLSGFSFSWTISLIFLGVVIGAINVYLFIRD